MQAGSATLIEKNVDRAASALFAAAAGYAAYVWLAPPPGAPLRPAEAGVIAAAAFLLCVRSLSAIQPKTRRLPVPVFDVREIAEAGLPELLLTDRYEEPAAPEQEPLVLEDILAELEPDSRVVCLFDPAAMPTPGQLNARIERHLVGDSAAAAPQDASEALHEALEELRRSLR
jgi:hypothetical protein